MLPEAEPLAHRTLRLLSASWRAHLQNPLAVALVIGASLALFLVGELSGRTDRGAADFSKLFAPPPLGSYSVVGAAQRNLFLLVGLIVARSMLVMGVLALLLAIPVGAKKLFRVVGVEAVGVLSLIVVVFLANLYFVQKAAALEDAGRIPIAVLLLLMEPFVVQLLTVLLAPLVCQAARGSRLRPVLTDGSIWIFSMFSTWLWMFGYRNIDAVATAPGSEIGGFALACATLVVQSILLAAIALRTIELDQGAPIVKRKSSVGASARALR